jgi:hypothetical protein
MQTLELPLNSTAERVAVSSTALLGVIRSVYESQDDILRGIQQLHCPEGFECDMTYGNGAFWKNLPRPKYCFDVSPQKPEAAPACSMMLPLEPETLNNCVFDPPFLTYVKNGREHQGGKVAMTARFGGYYRYEELEDHYRHTISEAWRVLKPGGKMIFKCQDIIHNHRMHCTHYRVIMMAEIEGFRLADLFILPARYRMPGPQKGTQRHARIFHSYFLVLEKPTNGRRISSPNGQGHL